VEKADEFSSTNIFEIVELSATTLRIKQLSTSIIFRYEKLE